jgi:hypothetical protein
VACACVGPQIRDKLSALVLSNAAVWEREHTRESAGAGVPTPWWVEGGGGGHQNCYLLTSAKVSAQGSGGGCVTLQACCLHAAAGLTHRYVKGVYLALCVMLDVLFESRPIQRSVSQCCTHVCVVVPDQQGLGTRQMCVSFTSCSNI